MPRSSNGTYTLPIAPFTVGGLIKSADHNSNYSDIATALTQSLATTGVSPMTGPIKAASGTVASPSYTFSSNTGTGFYLPGANQIGWSANGVQGATFNSDLSVTWAGNQTINGNLTVTGSFTPGSGVVLTSPTINTSVTFNATTWTFGAGAANGFWNGLGSSIAVALIIDGGGIAITTGVKGYLQVPFACTITSWTVIADQSGSIAIDVLRANGSVPSSSIVGAGNKPTLSSAQLAANTAPSSWTSTSIVKNDLLGFNVTSVATVQRVTVQLIATRTGA